MTQVPNAWDVVFHNEGRVFAEPHEDMSAFLELLRERGARRRLDVGSGSGRHTVYFAQQGLRFVGLTARRRGFG